MKYSDFRAFRKALDAGTFEERSHVEESSRMEASGGSGGYREVFFKYRETERIITFPGLITLSESIKLKDRYEDRMTEIIGEPVRATAITAGGVSPFDKPCRCYFSVTTEEDL